MEKGSGRALNSALALAAAQVLIAENLYDAAYVAEQTDLPLLVRKDTERFLRGDATEATPPGALRRLQSFIRRRRALSARLFALLAFAAPRATIEVAFGADAYDPRTGALRFDAHVQRVVAAHAVVNRLWLAHATRAADSDG